MNHINYLELVRKEIKKQLENPDQKAISLSLILEKFPSSINELFEQLKIITNQEYPYLDKYTNIEQYCRIYLKEDKINDNYLESLKINKEDIKQIKNIINSNIKIDIKNQKQISKNLAQNILDLIETKKEIENQIKKLLEENYPNTYYLLKENIFSKMLVISGSFKRLSSFPASTIQLLGSEKSFFKALKENRKTPKYGIIYTHPLLSDLDKRNKGRFARTFASKISIALKADIQKSLIYKDLEKKLLEKKELLKNEKK